MDEARMRTVVEKAQVCRVGTIDGRGRVHLVPVTYVVDGDTWYSPSDAGPRAARRLRNLESNPNVTILVDRYDADWSKVWWVRLRGVGRLADGAERGRALELLFAKYPQFGGAPSEEGSGPVMAVDVQDWAGWSYAS